MGMNIYSMRVNSDRTSNVHLARASVKSKKSSLTNVGENSVEVKK